MFTTFDTLVALVALAGLPRFFSLPLAGSMANTTTSSEIWWAASRNLPLGSILKSRGSLPPLGTFSTSVVSLPVLWSTEKAAMLSWPRLET